MNSSKLLPIVYSGLTPIYFYGVRSIPFPTALMGDYLNNPMALTIFGFILSLVALGFTLMGFYILKNGFILKREVDKSHFITATKKSILFGPVLY